MNLTLQQVIQKIESGELTDVNELADEIGNNYGVHFSQWNNIKGYDSFTKAQHLLDTHAPKVAQIDYSGFPKPKMSTEDTSKAADEDQVKEFFELNKPEESGMSAEESKPFIPFTPIQKELLSQAMDIVAIRHEYADWCQIEMTDMEESEVNEFKSGVIDEVAIEFGNLFATQQNAALQAKVDRLTDSLRLEKRFSENLKYQYAHNEKLRENQYQTIKGFQDVSCKYIDAHISSHLDLERCVIIKNEEIESLRQKCYNYEKQLGLDVPKEIREARKLINDCEKDMGFMGSPDYYEAKKSVDKYNESLTAGKNKGG